MNSSNVCANYNVIWETYYIYVNYWFFYTTVPLVVVTVFGTLAYRNMRTLANTRQLQGADRQLTHMILGQIILIIISVLPEAIFYAYSTASVSLNKTVEQAGIEYFIFNIVDSLAAITYGVKQVEHFDQLNLRESLLRGIYNYGFERPAELQQRTLKPCISGRDIIVQAQSGTGKSAACIIAILQQIDMDCNDCQALILAPTRELSQGLHRLVLALGEHMNITYHSCVGGTKIRDDIKRLEAGTQVVVGTPGRICDMLKKSILRSEKMEILVLDEADEILYRGFDEQINEIRTMLPGHIQIIVLSTTMPQYLCEMTQKLMNNPVHILLEPNDRTLEGIRQFYINIEREERKLDTLYGLLDTLTTAATVICCNTYLKVDWLTEKLREHGFTVSALHVNMDAKQYNNAMNEFRTGSSRILIRTDALLNNTDVPQVALVINYEVPIRREHYIRRIGRYGAFGRKGTAITFITQDEQQTLRDIEKFYNTSIQEMPMDIADLI
ncbi:unnamed protein product [Adineta steineri]|uniref:RNA helicase n=2 Tax=Adineta steineri TaxID=433720 RepID=A0A813MJZ5_9BILA|nr:unnamed protein product [Adineta steineri]